MSVTASWLRRYQLELGWGVFALANAVAMGLLAPSGGGTIPFHFIWVSLTLLYGFTFWSVRSTAVVLVSVMGVTSALIVLEVKLGPTTPDGLTEVPLMAAMFLATAWHARRRLASEREAISSRERERAFIRDFAEPLAYRVQPAASSPAQART
jgi:hypothetical protein